MTSAAQTLTILQPHRLPPVPTTPGDYTLEFVRDRADLEAVYRLRYEVFNLELQEGLETSHASGLDRDEFDPWCHHLVVRETTGGRVVGTYRMQTRDMADAGRGFYAATEFQLSSLPESLLAQSLEIGRACIARDHRNLKVLYLLWKGLGHYLEFNGLRYLFGCCSLSSQDGHEATRVYNALAEQGHLDPHRHVDPLPSHRCLVASPSPGITHIPRLMRAYLSLGARICSGPALDRAFKTVDYLALFDLDALAPARLAFFQCR